MIKEFLIQICKIGKQTFEEESSVSKVCLAISGKNKIAIKRFDKETDRYRHYTGVLGIEEGRLYNMKKR